MAYFHFLGTGPSTPITDATGRNYRRRSSALMQHISSYVLIDATHDFEEQADVALSITGVVITNPSRDAAGGLGNLDRWVSGPTPVYIPQDLWDAVNKRFGPFQHLTHHPVTCGQTISLQDMSMTCFPLITSGGKAAAPNYGYQFDNGKKKVCYASDVKKIPEDSLQYFKDNTLLVVDSAGWDKDLPTHRGALNHLSTYVEWGNQQILFTDVGRSAPPHTLASAAIQRLSRNADVAYDFMKVPLGR